MTRTNYSKRQKPFPFHLKRPKSDRPTGIYLKTSFGATPFKYGIGKSIYPELWNKEISRPTSDKVLINEYEKLVPHLKIDLKNIRVRIENIERTIKTYISDIESKQKIFNLKELRNHLDEVIKKVVKPQDSVPQPFILPYMEEMIKGMKKGTVIINSGKNIGRRYTDGTIKNYEGFKTQWELFEKSLSKKIRFNEINIDLYNSLISFFNAKSLGANTIGRHIRNLKVIMQKSYDKGIHSNETHRNKSFSAPEVTVTNVFLNEDELKLIAELSLEDRPHYQLIRDVFLIGCYSGLRFSDYSRIRPNHIKEKTQNGKKRKEIDMITRKTGERVVIPIKHELDVLLKKYNCHIPKTYEQKVNEHIKDIVREAKITEQVEVEKIQGGMKVKIFIPKCDLVKTHTARRSAITNWYNAGVPIEWIMKISGHKTEKSFRKYLIIGKDEAAAKMAEMDYFREEETKIVHI